MVVLILEKVPASLRGELSRWMIEPRTGVFVGRLSGVVRDKLWERACKGALPSGAAIMLYSSQTEQGYTVRSFGEPKRVIMDMEGLQLVHVPQTTRKTSTTTNNS
ncbi:MAG: type I-E CRISPR-associated endoribonuclease Cas2e [Armatimonadetes bacterium]|nr:type I-E CRISPR-associated endoribonuclease Cas2e [Armatimonadota bacterium]